MTKRNAIEANKMNWANPPVEVNDIVGYASALIGFMLQIANKRHLHKNDWRRTVFIDTLGVSNTDFDITQPKIDALVSEGKKGVVEHFNWRAGEGVEFPK